MFIVVVCWEGPETTKLSVRCMHHTKPHTASAAAAQCAGRKAVTAMASKFQIGNCRARHSAASPALKFKYNFSPALVL